MYSFLQTPPIVKHESAFMNGLLAIVRNEVANTEVILKIFVSVMQFQMNQVNFGYEIFEIFFRHKLDCF